MVRMLNTMLQMLVDRDLPQELQHTWEINPEDLQLVKSSDGQPMTLGQGACGTVHQQTSRMRFCMMYASL